MYFTGPTRDESTANRLPALDAEHHDAEHAGDKLLSTGAPPCEVDDAVREVGHLAGECRELGAVRVPKLIAEEGSL